MQMPRTGTPRSTASRTAASSPCSRMRRMASPKLPTPGQHHRVRPGHRLPAHATTVTSAPSRSSALVALRRLLIS